jgi:hypothetical protein
MILNRGMTMTTGGTIIRVRIRQDGVPAAEAHLAKARPPTGNDPAGGHRAGSEDDAVQEPQQEAPPVKHGEKLATTGFRGGRRVAQILRT